MTLVTLHGGFFAMLSWHMEVPRCAGRTARRTRGSADSRHVTNNLEQPPSGNTLIAERRSRAPNRSGYAARRGTLLTSTVREACHAS
jgi:hypothetical protein